MTARITREIIGAWVGYGAGRCFRCMTKVAMKHGYYRCGECHVSLCMSCYRAKAEASDLSRRDVSLMILPGPGDILLTGPCVSVTHVILMSTAMKLNVEHRDTLKIPEDQELYECGSVESTPFYPMDCIIRGHLSRKQYFFRRDPFEGTVYLVGLRAWDSKSSPIAIAPLYCKFVFHPFGRSCSTAFDMDTFQEAMCASEHPGSWSNLTALKAVFSKSGILDASQFLDAKARALLLPRLRDRWARGHICSSVAIEVWQRYFEMLHGVKAAAAFAGGGSGTEERQEALDAAAVADILRWMPLKADLATPSRLVKALTACHWCLRDDLPLAPCCSVAAIPAVEMPGGPSSVAPVTLLARGASGGLTAVGERSRKGEVTAEEGTTAEIEIHCVV